MAYVPAAAVSAGGIVGPWPLLALDIAAAYGPPYDLNDEPITAARISDKNIELRGRYVRQWTEDGVLVLLFNGGFRLDFAGRRMTADSAVVWATPLNDEQGRRYHELTVYLSENAEVLEPAGTITTDHVLLVRGLRTVGQIVKYQDAHLAESAASSSLYLQAVRDRALAEAGEGQSGILGPADILRPPTAKPQRVIRYRLNNIEPAHTAEGEAVFVSTGGVYFSQDGGPEAPMLEIRADHAVVFPAEGAADAVFATASQGEARPSPPTASPTGKQEPRPAPLPGQRRERGELDQPGPDTKARQPGLLGMEPTDAAAGRVRGVYLEGDVMLSLGTRFVRAHRLYYDFENDRALILDAVFRADVPQRGIPLYVRANEIRQLSTREFSAHNAVVSTSEFYTPSYHIGAERVIIRDVTPRDAEGRAMSPLAGAYELKNTTLNIEGLPVAWWPYSQGRLEQSETLLRSFTMGYSDDLGARLETRWYLFNLLGVTPPPGVDATLRLDYFSQRGPATGIDVDYEQEDQYGLLRSYYIHDSGKDDLGPLRRGEEDPSTENRGRLLWRHRHYLPYDWEATLEFSYISDQNFLEEYEKDEFFEGKEQESLIYLKRAKGNEALTLLANWRLLDFLTQTEHLPDVVYRRLGDTWFDPVVLYHESRFGVVRYRPDDRHFIDRPRFNNWGGTDATVRGDIREEAELPLKFGPVSVAPFASIRGTYWDGQPLDDGSVFRGLGMYGARGSTIFSKVYSDIQSDLLDVHGIRHIVKPDFAGWFGHSNVRSWELSPFDYGVETIDPIYGATMGVRQTWQTKRGPETNRRTVDWITLNLEMGVFGNTEDGTTGEGWGWSNTVRPANTDISNGWANTWRPENSRTRNYLAGDLIYRLSDSTSVLYDFNIDLNDFAYDRHNISLAVERNPRLAYVLGARYAGDIEMSLIGGGWNYKLTEKHLTAFRGWWDCDTGRLGEITLSYVRKLPRWYAAVNFEYSNVDDDFNISLSLWPEGIPEWTLGNRRFTTLGTFTGIRP